MAEVGVADQAELLEQLEGAVDGGDVDAGRRAADRRDDLLRRGVARARRRPRGPAGAAASAGSPWRAAARESPSPSAAERLARHGAAHGPDTSLLRVVRPVLALLTDPPRLVDPATPVLRADDLGVARGESVFETLRVAGGRAAVPRPAPRRGWPARPRGSRSTCRAAGASSSSVATGAYGAARRRAAAHLLQGRAGRRRRSASRSSRRCRPRRSRARERGVVGGDADARRPGRAAGRARRGCSAA